MKKLFAAVICVALMLACFGVFAYAEDEAVSITVYKIDPEFYYEGCICVYTSERGETLGKANENFAWWTVAAFEPDEASGGYKCTYVSSVGGEDKSAVVIPEGGFVIAGNVGNDWPSLFATATGSEWFYNDKNSEGIPYSECPNYANDAIKAEVAKIAALQVGDIMYLDGIDLSVSEIDTNDDGETIFYYSENFTSSAFVTSVKPTSAPVVDDPSEAPSDEPSAEVPSEEPVSKPETPVTADSGIVALAVVSVLALAGAAVVKKTR